MIVCVAGPIAAGKNYVCSILAERGFFCLDADEEIHKIIGDKQAEIFSRFCEPAAARKINLKNADGSLNRRALGKLLFKDPALLAEQEKILYPEFVERVQALIDKSEKASQAKEGGATGIESKPKTARENCVQAKDATQKAKGFTGQNASADFGRSESFGITNNSIKAQEGGAGIGSKPKTAGGSGQPITAGRSAAGGSLGLANARGLVINAALLYKTPSLLRQCQKIIYVDAPLFVRAWRIRRRDRLPLSQIIRRIKSQKGLLQEYQRFAADYGIEIVRVWNWGRGAEKALAGAGF